ncbi:uncharacterized protein TM35_000441100 [Trypanosoma theileri]|uniref:Uncharacterized protein n=1 Tax=Trypanosoma theileri TaxID=67003 RepID=A0A1X0NI70_9TRYP|nr:uncharacterized protein TM35_000441100 [Trypanosoma theileri]ORC84454.1 hypothetical protein TM35_000441100 [Trypanosoma theileri]
MTTNSIFFKWTPPRFKRGKGQRNPNPTQHTPSQTTPKKNTGQGTAANNEESNKPPTAREDQAHERTREINLRNAREEAGGWPTPRRNKRGGGPWARKRRGEQQGGRIWRRHPRQASTISEGKPRNGGNDAFARVMLFLVCLFFLGAGAGATNVRTGVLMFVVGGVLFGTGNCFTMPLTASPKIKLALSHSWGRETLTASLKRACV